MPLSEEELRLLEQMEHALAQEDPKFASTLRGSTLERVARMRTIAAAASSYSVSDAHGRHHQAQIWLGVLGFVVMLASATIGLAAWRGRHVPRRSRSAAARTSSSTSTTATPFDVIEGGRSAKPRRLRRPGGKPPAGPATRPPSRAPSCSAWSSAGSAAATRATDPHYRARLPAQLRRLRTTDTGHIPAAPVALAVTLPTIALRHESTVSTVRERTSGRPCPPAVSPAERP